MVGAAIGEGDTRAKLRIAGLAGGSQQNAGEVTLEFAIQPAAGEPFCRWFSVS